MLLILKFLKLFIKHIAYSFILFIFAPNLILYIMIKQQLISFKIDKENLPLLDSLCSEYGLKRNAMLNVLVRTGISCLSDKKAKYAILSCLSKSLLEFD